MLRRVFASLLLCPLAVSQNTWYVDGDGAAPGSGTPDDPYTSIQYALEQGATASGDTVLVRPGVYLEALVWPAKDLTLRSIEGPDTVVVDAGGVAPALWVQGATAALDGLTLQGGLGRLVGGAWRGGGVGVEDGDVRIANCVIRGNRGSRGAGIYAYGARLELLNTEVRDNDGQSNPGANLPGYGGGLFVEATQVQVQSCSLTGNLGKMNGGGVCVWAGSRLEMHDTEVAGNVAASSYDTRGNGLYVQEDTEVLLKRCSLVDNAGNGGTISAGAGYYGPGRLVDCTIEGNQAYLGAGVHGMTGEPGQLRLERCTLRGNVGFSGGGAVYARLENCSVIENRAASGGGGALFAELDGGQVVANVAGSPALFAGQGGGLLGCVATDVRIEDNIARGGTGSALGAGIYQGEARFCVIRGNRFQGTGSGRGGGAFGATLERCTLVENAAAGGGGGAADSVATGCILWDNTPNQVMGGSVAYSTVQGGAPGAGNLASDPQFWLPLSGDVHLKPTSPCIDAGDPSARPDTDGSPADQGALVYDREYCAAAGTWCTASPSMAGCVPAASALGIPSLCGSGGFVLAVSEVPARETGWLLWSESPELSAAFGGTLCLGGEVRRSRPMGTGARGGACGGGFELPLAMLALGGATPGTTIYAQFLLTDGAQPDSLALSNALEFTLCP